MFFGESLPPPRVARKLESNCYEPELISYSTTYYWFIVANYPSGGIDTSSLWSFTTRNDPNNPPFKPRNPQPIDNSVDILTNVTLSWESGDSDNGDILYYDIYFGYELPLLKYDTIGPFVYSSTDYHKVDYTISDEIYHNLTYYWQIEAKDNNDHVNKNEIWQFTTKEGPQLDIIIEKTSDSCGVFDFYANTTGGQYPYNWTWELNDEILRYEKEFTHVFKSDGNHTISVIVKDSNNINKKDKINVNIVPIDITVTTIPLNPKINEDVTFSANIINGCEPYNYLWDFDDENTSTNLNPTHSFNSSGSYDVEFLVTDKNGLSNNKKISFTIYNDPPSEPKITGPQQLSPNQQGSFTAKSTDSNDDDIRYGWDWNNDQQVDEWTSYSDSGKPVSLNHIWNSKGEYTIFIVAEDKYKSRSNWSAFSLSILNPNCPRPEYIYPPNNEPNVSRGTILEWEKNDEINAYNIFMKNESEDTFEKVVSNFKGNQKILYLNKDTTYYWKIEAICNDGSTCFGPIWTFTTKKIEDVDIIKPNPGNRQSSISINTQLQWDIEPDVDGITFDVYFGLKKDSLNKKSDKQSQFRLDLVQLNYDSDYFWRVVAFDEEKKVDESPLWRFHTIGTEPPPPDCFADAGGPYSGKAGDPIIFNGSNSYARDCDVSSYIWDFGDEEIGYGKSIEHSFQNGGTFNVELTIDCGDCGTSKDTVSVKVSPPPGPTITVFNDDFLPFFPGRVDNEYTFKLGAVDPEGNDVRFRISWGNNTNETITDFMKSGEEIVVYHTWKSKGDFNVEVVAENIHGSLSKPVYREYSVRFTLSIALYVIIVIGCIITIAEISLLLIAKRKGITT